MSDLILPNESYQIMGACFEVYKRMGCGFTEAIYQECLQIEFDFREIPFQSQAHQILQYREKILLNHFVPDFICFGQIIVEIKAVSKIIDDFRCKAINYLNATKLELALIVNFGHSPKLEYERFALTQKKAF
ncbi:MAG: GxxExxY protein [Bythopirellula sp.]|nr:GxxExxY protein [Bythopirellula sp.]